MIQNDRNVRDSEGEIICRPLVPLGPAKPRPTSEVEVLLAVCEAIRVAESIPAGHLYAQLIGVVSIEAFETCLAILNGSGLVSVKGNVVRWTGPKVAG